MEALRQLGRMLEKPGRAQKGRPIKCSMSEHLSTLSELGLTRKTSMLAQKIAKLPDEQFEAVKHRVVKRHGTPFCSFRAWRRDFSALRLPLASLFCSRLCLWWGKSGVTTRHSTYTSNGIVSLNTLPVKSNSLCRMLAR